jgi:hypothetical protein
MIGVFCRAIVMPTRVRGLHSPCVVTVSWLDFDSIPCPALWTCVGPSPRVAAVPSAWSGNWTGKALLSDHGSTGEARSPPFSLPSTFKTMQYLRGGGAPTPSGVFLRSVVRVWDLCVWGG